MAIKTEKEGLFLAVLYYMGLRKGEALGLRWEDINFDTQSAHIQRDIDYSGDGGAKPGALKTEAADRFVNIPEPLLEMFRKVRGFPGQYVFHTAEGKPLPENTAKRMWLRLMLACGLVEERAPSNTSRPNDIIHRYKPTLTPHYFRHNYVTKLFESGTDPLIAMKMVGHRDYQTTANIYTHLSQEILKKHTVKLDEVFAREEELIKNGGKKPRYWSDDEE